jgi:hypothetical protein
VADGNVPRAQRCQILTGTLDI